jgi:hypothetical protein
VRVETERRLKALEADLAKAERAKKERTMAQRYHKVKFFGMSGLMFASVQNDYKSPATQNARKLPAN